MRGALTKLRKQSATRMRGLVLDCGVGDGIYHPFLAGDRIVHLDVDMEALRTADGARVGASAAALPFPDNTFDSLWSCAVVEHVKEDCIPEFVRVVKPGGRIAVLTPNRYSPLDLLRRAFGRKGWWGYPGHVRLYSVGELARYGRVIGEIWWLPVIDDLVRHFPRLAHTLMLDFENKK